MSDLPTIDEALDELGLVLPRGRKLSCPEGNDSEPSLHVYEDGFYCFHCGRSGDGLGLIAFFTGQDVSRLYAERSRGDKTRIRSAATKGMRRGDVARHVARLYREVHNEWFKFLHDAWRDSPQWAFEQSLDIWSQAFDDLRDRILGHGAYDGDEPLTPYQAESEIARFRNLLEGQRLREQRDAADRSKDAARAEYGRRKRALVTSQVYETR